MLRLKFIRSAKRCSIAVRIRQSHCRAESISSKWPERLESDYITKIHNNKKRVYLGRAFSVSDGEVRVDEWTSSSCRRYDDDAKRRSWVTPTHPDSRIYDTAAIASREGLVLC